MEEKKKINWSKYNENYKIVTVKYTLKEYKKVSRNAKKAKNTVHSYIKKATQDEGKLKQLNRNVDYLDVKRDLYKLGSVINQIQIKARLQEALSKKEVLELQQNINELKGLIYKID